MSISKPVHILLATPCYGGVLHRGYFHAVLNLQKVCQIHNIQLTVHTLGNESLIPRGRNFYVALLLANPHITHLLFIDSDITFQAENIIRMVAFNKEITCGIYPKKGIQWKNILELSKVEGINENNIEQISMDYVINFNGETAQVENGFLKCLYGGTGCMLVKREVIEKLKEKYPEKKYYNDVRGYDYPELKEQFYAFFDCFICPTSKRYLSEDYAFCQICIEQGYDIWVDMTCNLIHTGAHDYNGSFGQYITFISEMNRKLIEEKKREEVKNEKEELVETSLNSDFEKVD